MNIFPHDNILPTRYLAACFNNTVATYKFYWLLAILDAVHRQEREIKKDQLFASMLSNAWYTVNYFQVSFGQQDLIQSTVRQLKDIEGITIDEDRAIIQNRLVKSEKTETKKLLLHFDNQVPHWFLSPWYPRKGKREVYQLSQAGENQPLYQLYKDCIVIPERWFDYLTKHVRIIRDYVYWNLSLFLQKRNPNVPDIPNKLIKPALRSSLLKQRKFWDVVIDANGPLRCIYTGKELFKGAYHVEHFIPYSFVSHNQIWNLIPSDNAFNVSKGNKLPPLDKYFDSFYDMQKVAIQTYMTSRPSEKLLEDYFYIGTDLQAGLSKEKFYDVINPLVTIASNNGFEFLSK
ncbi:HNH endonuclease domain-containing protein [Sphingobacterium wenxiniae]|uniref:HNH endonuclease n=1 Tax=Sphingobacterium wenxiniae TaxID=683125 RepID=A0A1I6V6T7_9SPHI|nr:HNH endonuclease domain-containing protein [Sphingobacterium wenxiniae]SFT09421.1 HNH endonuclease [Sphingobacterium wenxiniae]